MGQARANTAVGMTLAPVRKNTVAIKRGRDFDRGIERISAFHLN